MRMTASQVLMECLLEQGVDTVFGYPGGTILNIYDEFELHGYEEKIHHYPHRPRAGRVSRRRRLCPRHRQGGRLLRHLRPRRHQPGHRHRHRLSATPPPWCSSPATWRRI